MGVLSTADRAVIATYCQIWATIEETTETLNTEGRYLITHNGYKVPHPASAQQSKAIEQFHKISQQLGLTPASRPRIQTTETKRDDDKGKDYIKLA